MRFTISNLSLQNKPTREGMGKFLCGLHFNTRNLPLSQVRQAIEDGYTFTYLYKDDDFSYRGYDKANNYLGTQYIIVDVDKCDICPEDFIQGITYKPTIYHTTFSNLTKRKDNKWCFHLIYCLTDTVYGEDNFRQLFNTFTADYANYVDEAAKDCHRIVFSSNKSLPHFSYGCTGIVYDPSLFIREVVDVVAEDVTDEQATDSKNTIKQKNNFSLDEFFFNDLMTLGRKDFLTKYRLTYPIIRSTPIPEELIRETANGIRYADLRNFDYFEVDSKYRFDPEKGKGQVEKVAIGKRQQQMFFDISLFLEVNPSITKEGLVYAMVNEVWEFYDNSDKEMTNNRIIQRCAGLWDNRPTMKATGRQFKILECQDMNKRTASGVVKKLLKDEEIGSLLDLSLTLEDNLLFLSSNGVKTTKKRLVQFCDEYGILLLTNKEKRNNRILEFVNENPEASLRQLVQLCEGEGIDVKKDTIKKVLQGGCLKKRQDI